jgi:chromosome partitioning protein
MMLNAKGGCGKTTIATNLASYFAGRGCRTALMDFDPQGSGLSWLERRDAALPSIQPIAAGQRATGVTRSWQLHTQTHTEIVLVDTPAGVAGHQLVDLVPRADLILVPVMPSALDIQVTTAFIKELLVMGKTKRLNKPVAVIINRCADGLKSTHAFEHFLSEHQIPVITRLRDTPNYIHAMDAGKGVLELDSNQTAKDRTQWWPLTDWLHEQMGDKAPRPEEVLAG